MSTMWLDLTTLLLLPLAVARLTRLVTTDVIFDGLRDRVLTATLRFPDAVAEKMAYLITCRWCASVYVGAAAAAGWWAWGGTRWLLAVTVALAGSYTAGWLASKEDE